MKRLSNLLAALVFASLVIFMSCGGGGGDDGPTIVEEKTELISKTWSNPSTATYAGGPEGDWSGFSLTIRASGTYNTSGVPTGYEEVWPSSGSWEFTNDNAARIQRDGNNGITMDYTVADDGSSLSLEFTVPDPSARRISGLYGEPWQFEFE